MSLKVFTDPIKPKKCRISKRKKKAWRRVDIKDVELYYEDKLLVERIGGPLDAKPDAELFMIEKKGKGEKKEKKGVFYHSARERKRRAQLPPLCLKGLENTSKVKDPVLKRNTVKTKEERKSNIQRDIERKLREKGIRKKKEILAERSRAANLQQLRQKRRRRKEDIEFPRDAWSPEPADCCGESVLKDTERHVLTHTRQMRVRVPLIEHAPNTLLPAMEPPHPGTAYNPAKEAYRDLMLALEERQHEMTLKKENDARLAARMSNFTRRERKRLWELEFATGIVDVKESRKDEKESEEEKEEEEWTGPSVNPPAPLKRKLRKQRNKALQLKKEEAVRYRALVEKKKVSDIYRLRFLEQDLALEEEKSKLEQEKRKKKQEADKLRTKTVSNVKFTEPWIVAPHKRDLTGNLRTIKAHNVFADRFRSLQKRNIIELRVKDERTAMRKKAKMKKRIKADFKIDFDAELKKYGVDEGKAKKKKR